MALEHSTPCLPFHIKQEAKNCGYWQMMLVQLSVRNHACHLVGRRADRGAKYWKGDNGSQKNTSHQNGHRAMQRQAYQD